MNLYTTVEGIKKKLSGNSKWTTEWEGAVTRYDDGEIVTDKAVADFVRKHLRLIDRLNLEKVVCATMETANFLHHKNDPYPDLKNWKFFKDY